MVDAASLTAGLVVAKAGTGEGGFTTMSAGWIVGAPVVHAAHRRPFTALASLALRAGLVLGGYYAGGPCKTTCTTTAGACENDPNASEHWQDIGTTCNGRLAAMVGGMLASGFDSALLSWEDLPSATIGEPVPHASALRHIISIDSAGVFPTDTGAAFSLGGHF